MLENTLRKGIEKLGIEINEQQIELFINYVSLLEKWNKAYNLTAIRDPQDMVSHHILDSLSIVPYFKDADRVLDVGTGAGLPGVPLAIMYPDAEFTLLDSNGKKTRFIQQVKRELGLSNIEVLNDRVEKIQHNSFDMITSRAFADLSLMVKLSAHLLEPQGRMAAMKGPKAEIELAQLEEQGEFKADNIEIYPLNVPFLDGERNLVCFNVSPQ